MTRNKNEEFNFLTSDTPYQIIKVKATKQRPRRIALRNQVRVLMVI